MTARKHSPLAQFQTSELMFSRYLDPDPEGIFLLLTLHLWFRLLKHHYIILVGLV